MHGWCALNRALLDNKEIKGTMAENDKKRNETIVYNERENGIPVYNSRFLPNNSKDVLRCKHPIMSKARKNALTSLRDQIFPGTETNLAR